MKVTLALATLALALLQTCGNSVHAGTLDAALEGKTGWVAYHVPKVAGAEEACCFEWHGKNVTSSGCDLDNRSWNFGSSDSFKLPSSDQLAVYVRVERGVVDRVRAMSASCPVRTKSEIQWLDAVTPGQSIAFLEPLAAKDQKGDDAGESALAALAYHGDDGATTALSRLAGPDRPREQRQHALFWLGQARGDEGADIVERWATTDDDPDLRENAVFALSQSKGKDPYARIKKISLSDRDEDVRAQALFWMAQMNDPRCEADIAARVKADSSSEVREQAVFALSQLDDGRADTALIGILEGDYPRESKEKAMFWLGQSGSEKAIAYFDRILAADSSRNKR